MEIVILLCRQNVIMAIYLIVGYVLLKKQLLTEKGSGEIGKLLLYVVMPCAVLHSYMKDFSEEMLAGFLVSFLAAAASLAAAVWISRMVFRRQSAIRQFGAAFSNAGFIGIPLVRMTLGEDAVFYVASFVAILNILQWTYGVFIMTGDKSAIRLKKIAGNPIVISFLAGLALFFLPVQLPEVLETVVGAMADMNGPLAMLVLGAYLAQLPLRDLFTDRLTYLCAAVRLLLIPCITLLGLKLIPMEFYTVKQAVLLAAAAPVGSNVAIFAQLYGKEYRDAVKDVCLSTLLSVGTMPLVIYLADVFWRM